MTRPELIILDPDAAVVDALRRDFRLPFVTVVQGDGKHVTATAHLDALLLTWMQAEQFGITPRPERYIATVNLTPVTVRDKGFPRYIVAGVNFGQDDTRDLVERLRITVEAVLDAIAAFNSRSAEVIERVGTVPENLLLDKLSPATVAAVLEEAWQRLGHTARTDQTQ